MFACLGVASFSLAKIGVVDSGKRVFLYQNNRHHIKNRLKSRDNDSTGGFCGLFCEVCI